MDYIESVLIFLSFVVVVGMLLKLETLDRRSKRAIDKYDFGKLERDLKILEEKIDAKEVEDLKIIERQIEKDYYYPTLFTYPKEELIVSTCEALVEHELIKKDKRYYRIIKRVYKEDEKGLIIYRAKEVRKERNIMINHENNKRIS